MQAREIRLFGAGVGLLVCLGCGAGSTAFQEGRKAELRKDYDTALVNYEKAVQAQPDNSRYLIHEKIARTQASLFHLKKGRRLLAERRQNEAVGEFQKAASIDPVNQAAAQELARLLAEQAATKRAREKSIQQALQIHEEAAAPGVVRLKPFPSEVYPHFRLSADSRQVYQTLAKLADLNVAFTQDFQPRPISIDLTNVKLEEALLVVAHETKTFWKPITPNTILVIPDNQQNRRDYEEEVLKTIYLSNPLQQADRTAIATAVKQILGLQRIIDNPDSNAIIIRDTPSKVAAAERMIRDLDRGRAEILVEVSVIEADRDRIRDLGLEQVPTSPLLPSTAVAALGFNPHTPVTVTTGTGSSSTSTTIPALPLNRLGHISTHDFSIVVPGAVANALLNDTHTRILQNPQVRVTDGQTAKVKIGNRVPYATGSFLPSFGGAISGGGAPGGAAGFGLLASTQFQYQETGVNLDVTPHLLSSGEVALKAKIEISSLGPNFTIGGLQEPSFNQRVIEHDIRLKEGEVNLLGGLIEATTRRSLSGLPVLGEIPGLRYLFSNEHTERAETEVLVMLTPWVIRLPEATAGAETGFLLGSSVPTPDVVLPLEPASQPPGQPQ
jgi:general secretion pathway protein D